MRKANVQDNKDLVVSSYCFHINLPLHKTTSILQDL